MSHEDRQVTNGVRVEELSERYLQVHGALLNPCEYGFLSLSELLKSMPYLVEVRKSCSLAPGSLKHLHSLVLISLFFLSCTMSKATMTRLQPPSVVMARSASGWHGCTSLPVTCGPCSTPTTTTRSSWLISRQPTTNLQAAASIHGPTATRALMSCWVPSHRLVLFDAPTAVCLGLKVLLDLPVLI